MENAFITSELEVREANGARELVGISVPYGEVSHKAGPRPERFVAGAFARAVSAGIGKIRLRDHNHSLELHRPVAVVTELEDRAAGLWSRFRFYDTPEGRAAYENAREHTYGGLSVGFVAVRERIVDGIREILEAQLHHVSLVDEPAYDGAAILAVRSAAEYDWMRTVPTIDVPADDTPMLLRARQVLGNVRSGA